MFNNRVYSGLMPDGSIWITTSSSSPFGTANQSPKSSIGTMKNNYKMITGL